EKNTGVKKIPKSVTPSMPLNTAMPRDLRISAPAPEAAHNGRTPRMNANDVIRIGLSLNLDDSKVAAKTVWPSWCSCLANSTTRMAFLHARPTRTTSPICTKIFSEVFVYSTPAREHNTHNGTTRMTAKGRAQLS